LHFGEKFLRKFSSPSSPLLFPLRSLRLGALCVRSSRVKVRSEGTGEEARVSVTFYTCPIKNALTFLAKYAIFYIVPRPTRPCSFGNQRGNCKVPPDFLFLLEIFNLKGISHFVISKRKYNVPFITAFIIFIIHISPKIIKHFPLC